MIALVWQQRCFLRLTHIFSLTQGQDITKVLINFLKVLSLLLCRTSTLTLKRVLAEFKEFNLDFIFGTRATDQFGFAWEYPDVTGATDSPANTGGGRKRASRSLEGASLSRFWPPPLCAPFPVLSLSPSLPASVPFSPLHAHSPLPPPLLCPNPPPTSLPTIVAASQTVLEAPSSWDLHLPSGFGEQAFLKPRHQKALISTLQGKIVTKEINNLIPRRRIDFEEAMSLVSSLSFKRGRILVSSILFLLCFLTLPTEM